MHQKGIFWSSNQKKFHFDDIPTLGTADHVTTQKGYVHIYMNQTRLNSEPVQWRVGAQRLTSKKDIEGSKNCVIIQFVVLMINVFYLSTDEGHYNLIGIAHMSPPTHLYSKCGRPSINLTGTLVKENTEYKAASSFMPYMWSTGCKYKCPLMKVKFENS